MRLNIFVPALMSVGFVFWVSALVRDQLRLHRAMTLERRSVGAGRTTAEVTAGRATAHAAVGRDGADRRLFLLSAAPFLALATYVVVGGIANYVRPNGYVSGIGWLLAVTLLIGLLFAGVGGILVLLSAQWPAPSPRLLNLARKLPFTPVAPDGEPYARPKPAFTGALLVVAGSAAFTAMIVGSSRGFLSRIDEPLLDLATDAGWLGALSKVDLLGSSPFAVVAATLLGLASFRCRVMLAAYPAALITAFVTSNLLRALIERPRPPEGPLAGGFDSFPSGHLIMTTILVGLLPLTAAVMLHTTRVTRPLRWFAAGAVVLAAFHRVHGEAHWPTDVLGGVLIGAAIVIAVEWAVAHELWHRRCNTCPWTPESEPVEHATIPLHVDVARLLAWSSHAAAAAVALLLAVLATTRGLPSEPEGVLIDPQIQRPLQLALAGLVSFGALVSWRAPAVGAVLLAFGAAGLGTFAALQYEPLIALALTLLVSTPAVLLWLSWQHRRRHGEIVALALVTGGLLMGTWFAASLVYSSIFGPTHPASSASRLPVDHVEWVWLGGLSSDSIRATARADDDDADMQLVVTDGEETWPSEVVRPSESDTVRFAVDGLRPGRDYEYVIEVDGEPDEGRGRGTFRTPADGAASFRLVASSCARVDSNGAVFDAIAAEDPLLYLMLGDAHYSNIADNDEGTFRTAYDRMLTQPGPAALVRNVPISYVWDDHDYGPNDSDADSPSRDAAREAFREQVPSHELASDGPINRAYTIGRVRFIVTDTRSERRGETMLGREQLAWFEDEVVRASRSHALVVWMNPSPWIGEADPAGDGWAGFADERRHIADTLADADVDNLLMVSGDAHMLAFDDGTNSGYASDGSAGFPVFHTAALDRPGNVKGGPYSGGAHPGFGQYGVIDIDDDGERVVVQLTGKNYEGEVLISEELRFAG